MRGGEIELSEDELAMVAGGKGACLVIGGSDGPEASTSTPKGWGEGHACFFVGVGGFIPITPPDQF